MYFLLPYRCKNPPEQYPYATIGLIVVNVLVYLCTTHDFLIVKDGVVADFGVSPSTLNPLRLITAMFLHEEPLHIGGNMLFLWLFGAAVEGRLRVPKFLLVYFIAGIAGGLMQCSFQSAIHNDEFGIGASGAIMGLAGAYLYIFPFARIMIFRFIWLFIWIRFGPVEWLAWWVVAYYMGINVFNAILEQWLGISGGTAFFAHIGGFSAGLLTVLALQARRDSAQISQVQAIRADTGNDLTLLTANELENLLQAPTENMEMVLAYCNKAIAQQGELGEQKAIKIIERYKAPLLTDANAVILADIVLRIPRTSAGLSGPFYLRLGGKLEQLRQFEMASNIYRRVYDLYGTSPDAGAALIRLARIWEQVFRRPDLSREAYSMYLSHFSSGPLVEDAQQGLIRVDALSRKQVKSSE